MRKREIILEIMIQENKFVKEIKFMIEILKKENSLEEKKKAQRFLDEVQQKQESICHIYPLLQSYDEDLVFFSLQILEGLIDFNWENLSLNDKNFALTFASEMIYEKTSSKLFLDNFPFCKEKVKYCFVKIILKLTPNEMILFLKNLVESIKMSEFIFETNLKIINSFFEEVLIKKNSEIKRILKSNDLFIILFKEIEKICQNILEKTCHLIGCKPELLNECLKCLGFLIKISPISYYFENRLLLLLVLLCPKRETMNLSLTCLIELIIHGNESNGLPFMKVFMDFIIQFQELLPFGDNIGEIFKFFTKENKQFIMNTIILTTNVFKNKADSMEYEKFSLSSFSLSNQMIVKFTSIPSIEVFKICLVWWVQLIEKNFNFDKFPMVYRILEGIFFDLRIIIICRMAKPEEVFIREEENGEIVNEKIAETEALEIYKNSKKILLYLTTVDKKTTQDVILKKLNQQLIFTNWNRKVLNTVSWAIGSIAEIFSPDNDGCKLFFVTALKDLLYLCELRKKKKDKAVIASNIMFVVRQYPNFLKNHWKFCKTVIEKLFEFLGEPQYIPGFKDMACDTFFCIAKSCGNFISKNSCLEKKNFLDQIFISYSRLKSFLPLRLKKQFLCSLAIIAGNIEVSSYKEKFVSKIALEINKEWLNSLNLFELHFYEISSLQINKFIFWLKTNLKILNILKNCYFQNFEFFGKSFYFLIFAISEKLILKMKRTPFNSFSFEDKNSLTYLKKNLFRMLLKSINIISQRKTFSNFDKYCIELIDPIFFYFNKQKNNGYFDNSVLYFTIDLFQTVDFFKNLESFRLIFKEILFPFFGNEEESKKFLNFSQFESFRLLRILINYQFSGLLKLDPDPKVSQRLFESIMFFLGKGLEHENESICQISLKTFKELLKKIDYSELEEYFTFNFSEMFMTKIIKCSFTKISKKSKKILIRNVQDIISKLKTFLDFDSFDNILTNLFSRRNGSVDCNEFSNFIFSLYYVKDVCSLSKEIRFNLKMTSLSSSSSTDSSQKYRENSLSEFPLN